MSLLCLKPIFSFEIDRQNTVNYIKEMSLWMFVKMRTFGIGFKPPL